jgi:pimeloyl-ACP methyl ester carboxylesterase
MPRTPIIRPTLTALAALGIRERSTRAAAARTACPVAVRAGEYDPVTPLEEARAIATAAPRSRLAIIPHGRHDDFHTLGREEMTAALTWVAHARN